MTEEASKAATREVATSMVEITSEKELNDVISGSARTMVYMWADWAQPCQQMSAVFEALHKQYGQVMTFARVDAQAQTAAAARYKVKTVPTMLVFGGGRLARRVEGADAAAVTRATVWLADASADAQLTAACEQLLWRAPIVLLSKGGAGAAKCAFCRQVMQLLHAHGVVFDTVDVLGDARVRDRVREVARWETFPALFARGRLIGGVDAVQRLIADDRLVAELSRDDGDALPPPGADREHAQRQPSPLVAPAAPASEGVDEDEAGRLRARLDAMVRRAPIMLFMKGTPNAPRCGFSRRMSGMLRAGNVTFEHFDILTDDTVRQGLKTYAQWPTFPQLYAHGRFVGGLDVVTELADMGELADELKS